MFAWAPSLKRNVLASWIAHGLTVVIGFFLMPYVIRVLGDHSYGTWVFVNSMASYAGLLYFGFGDTISRYVARYDAERDYRRLNQIVSIVLAIYLSMGLVAAGIACGLAVAAPWLSTWTGHELVEVQLTILVLGLNVAAGMAGSVYGGVLMGRRRFDLERGVSFASDLLRLVMIFVFLQQDWGILRVALIYLVITSLEGVAYLILAHRSLPQLQVSWRLLDLGVLKECSSFSAMAFLNAIAYQMTNATDSVVIGFTLGTEAIVPYYIALRLTQFIKQPIDKIAQICMPTAGALSKETDRRRMQRFLLKTFGLTFLLICGMFIGAWFFGGAVIKTWMGEGYEASHHILCILLAAQVIGLPCNVLRAFLFGLGTVRAPAILYLIESCCNLLLSIALVYVWGQVGVAWGTLIPVVLIELGLLLPMALSRLGISIRRLLHEALLPQLLPLTVLTYYAWGVTRFAHDPASWPMLIGLTLGGGVALAIGWGLARILPTSRPAAG